MLVVAVAEHVGATCSITSIGVLGQCHPIREIKVKLVEGDIVTRKLAVNDHIRRLTGCQCHRVHRELVGGIDTACYK